MIIDRNGSGGQQSAEITKTDLVAAKFEIEKAKMRIVGMSLSHIYSTCPGRK